MHLHTISDVYRSWEQAVEANEGEITPELEQILADIQDNMVNKGAAVCALIRNAQIEATAYRQEAEIWTQKARIAIQREHRLKKLLLKAMKSTGLASLDTGKFVASVRKAGVPAIRWTGDPEKLPEWARRTRVEPDGTKIQEAFRAGHKMEGFVVEFTEFLNIR